MESGKVIVSPLRFQLTLKRLCHQVLENHENATDLCIIGIQDRGVYLADRLCILVDQMTGSRPFKYGKLDITFYRDDFRRRDKPLRASTTQMDFAIEGKKVLLVDDVLYTGRTVHAAITTLQDYGRPASIELLCMVDRRFNRHFPIRSDYTGIAVDALDQAYVRVRFNQTDGTDAILLFSGKQNM